ncbi:hypothetical protein ANCCEY_00986 [Ancylostoma ceylanicum]|uniref:Uncharacterized protein n=2 Tax=Ancylostoma ceylanicum TaxID=53326 RepID=A0A8I3B3S3_9BILA|nr:hypothetical protein ANCCEY_00986 [Ancylostoma ceylanicum]EYC02551.1 hypothetical protein Y032_0099g3177 [Ancylostoma ceylanicum]
MKLASSLTNMLGEFVAMQKSPDFKPCSASMQELDRAVKEEKRSYSEKQRATRPRPRFMSVGDVPQEVSMDPAGEVTMRSQIGKRRDRPSSLIERIKQRISPTRTNEAITEEEEGDTQVSRRLSTRSEKLYIHIV